MLQRIGMFTLLASTCALRPPVAPRHRGVARTALPLASVARTALPLASVDLACAAAGAANLALYQQRLDQREQAGEPSWRRTQGEARREWCRHVYATEGWLYAVQTLRNGITTNTFLASTARAGASFEPDVTKVGRRADAASRRCSRSRVYR